MLTIRQARIKDTTLLKYLSEHLRVLHGVKSKKKQNTSDLGIYKYLFQEPDEEHLIGCFKVTSNTAPSSFSSLSDSLPLTSFTAIQKVAFMLHLSQTCIYKTLKRKSQVSHPPQNHKNQSKFQCRS